MSSTESISILSAIKNMFSMIGDFIIFSSKFFKNLFKYPYEINEIIKQIYELGNKSLFLVSLSSFIIGFVMTVHLIPAMRVYGVEDMVPNMAAISIIREIGPVITAMVCAGKIGSAIGAEIGAMKVTEQIDAMSISGVNAYQYLVVTRVVATSFAMPILIFYSGAVAMFGSFIAENMEDQMSLNLFVTTAFSYLYFHDIIPTVIKSFLFGFAIGMVGCYYGYHTVKGAAGVGKSAHVSVVVSSIIIFFIDLLVVEIAHLFY